jgi:hypothetical protein
MQRVIDREMVPRTQMTSKHVHVSTFKVACENSRREMMQREIESSLWLFPAVLLIACAFSRGETSVSDSLPAISLPRLRAVEIIYWMPSR